MKSESRQSSEAAVHLTGLLAWATSGPADTAEIMAFRSGAALVVLDAMVSDPGQGVPLRLLANRLALGAATATSKLEGRLAREADIRDAFHLAQPGEARGPDGDLLAFWRQAGRLRMKGRDWPAGLGELAGQRFEESLDAWLEAGFACAKTHGPLAGCVLTIRSVLAADGRAERIACLLSDVVLAHVLNWQRMLPVTAQGLTKAQLRGLVSGGDVEALAVQGRILGSVQETITLARDLRGRAAALRTVAPKLRAKGSEAAVALFLTEDVVGPSGMLSPLIQGSTFAMTDRSARRFCDRLVELGVARELTGRSTFRLYGIAP